MLIKGQLCPLNSHCRITCEIGTSSDDMSYSTYTCGMKKNKRTMLTVTKMVVYFMILSGKTVIN